MLAALTGARMLFNYFRIGGVNGDLNHEFMSRLGDWMSRAARQTEANATLLNENEIFVRRARGIGVLDRDAGAPNGHHRRQPARLGRRRSTSAGRIRTASTPSSSSTSRRATRATRWPAT